MIKIVGLENTGIFCPTQWLGNTEDGRKVYIRFRFGCFSFYLDEKIVFEVEESPLRTFDGFDGVMDNEEMLSILEENQIEVLCEISMSSY